MQDEEPLIAVLHANYAADRIFALREVASDAEVFEVSAADGDPVDARSLEDAIKRVQDEVTRRLVVRCPSVQPAGPLGGYARQVAW
jgi:hypothetical protein